MKNLINKFSNINECVTFTEKENFKVYEFVATFNKIDIPSKNDIIRALDLIPTRDKISFSVKTDYISKIYLSNTCNIDEFYYELKELITNKEPDEKYYIEIMITKNIQNDILSIYSLESYEQFLISQQLEVLNIFNKYLTENKYIIFECQDEIEEFYTSSLYFINKNTNVSKYVVDNKSRSEILNKRNDVCSFLNAAQSDFIPDDFSFIKYSGNTKLSELFDKLKVIVSISFICNICSIDYDKKSLYYKINGYRTVKNDVIFKDIPSSFSNQIYCIYEWIYNDGNLSDKIGLARNIISLHVDGNDLFALENNTLDSIKSSYEIYLKENINKYLQLRVTINENILKLLNNLEELVDELVEVILKFILGGLSVVFTVVVMNSIYSGNLIEVITGDLAIICIGAVIILNIILLCIIIPNIQEKFNRYEKQFVTMKETYRFILDSKDLDQIFDKGKFIDSKKEDFTKGLNKYMKIWFIIQMVLISIILIA